MLDSFDFLHSWHKWVQAILSCGKHCATMKIRTVWGLWFCWRSWRLKIDVRVKFCAYSEAIRSCQQVGCARNRPQFHITPQKLNFSLDTGLRMAGIPALDFWDLVMEVFHSFPNPLNNTKDQVPGKQAQPKSNQGSNPTRQFGCE